MSETESRATILNPIEEQIVELKQKIDKLRVMEVKSSKVKIELEKIKAKYSSILPERQQRKKSLNIFQMKNFIGMILLLSLFYRQH